MVRRENSEYVYLGDIFFSEGRNPFTGEPLDQWFTGPTSEFKISLMLLIQNYHINRMKQEQQVEYTINQSNPGEPNTSSFPYQPYNVDSQTSGKSASTVTYTFPTENLIDATDPHPVEIKHEDTAPKNVSRHDKQPAADITRPIHWYSTSEPSSTASSFYNQSNPPQNQANTSTVPPPKDWSTLQQEQTQKIQEIVAQMAKPKKSKKKKGKKPAQNVTNPVQKKPNELDNAKPLIANNPSSQKN
jgi:hypothetical protein